MCDVCHDVADATIELVEKMGPVSMTELVLTIAIALGAPPSRTEAFLCEMVRAGFLREKDGLLCFGKRRNGVVAVDGQFMTDALPS
jgi:hypothetical protein